MGGRSGRTGSYAIHVVNGAIAGGWTADGVAICPGQINTRNGRVLVPGNAGDVFVVWNDYRAGNSDIYAQRLLSNGTVAPGWPANGLALTNLVKNEFAVRACSDGAGNFYAVWTLEYTPGADYDLYASRVLKAGSFATGFAVNGVV